MTLVEELKIRLINSIDLTRNLSDKDVNEIITKMAEQGVATNVHYKPLPMLTAYKQLGFDAKDYPNAAAYFTNEISLPLHTLLTDEDVQYVIDTYAKVLEKI